MPCQGTGIKLGSESLDIWRSDSFGLRLAAWHSSRLTEMDGTRAAKEWLPGAQRQTPDLSREGLLLDLDSVSVSKRRSLWTRWVPETFPGMVVDDLTDNTPVGVVRRMRLGPAFLWTILTTSQRLRCIPPPVTNPSSSFAGAAIMLQMSGNDEITQNDKRIRLSPGEICLVNGSLPFQIEVIGVSRVVLFTFPQALAKSRLAHLFGQCVQRFGDQSAEFRVFRAALLETFSAAGGLASNAAAVVCESLISLFSVIPEPDPIDDNHRFTRSRIKQALHLIDRLIDDPDLSATSVAQRQHISRRRLDALFQKELGMTVAAQIMERRLAQAASDLCDPGKVSATISEVAYGAGFKDPAHFTRAFTRRFGRTPSSWKQSAQTHQ